MKKRKLFAMLFAVLGVGILSAQEWTDKTSLLINPSFESQTGATNLKDSGWGAPTEGWTLAPATAPSNSQSGVAASSCTIQGLATTLPTSDDGNYFYVRTNWNNDVTFSLSQTVSGELPNGLYRLTCKAASNSGNWSTAKFNLTLKEGDNISTNSSLNKCSEWTEWTVELYKTDPSTSLTIEATMYPGSSGSGQHYQLLLDDFKLEYQSFDEIEAAGWPEPQVPGSNIKSFVGTSVVAALYNVGSDAFVTRGMSWATQAIATKLHNSDSQEQTASDRHHVKVSAGDGDLVRFTVNGKNYLGDGGQGSTTTVYTDNGTATNQFIYSELNKGTYKLKVANATSDENAFLDVSQPYGGQLTYANGQGFTEWAIIKFSDIENGKYASYKAKRTMYEVYKAVVDAGHSATYSDALRTALETYIKPNATASDVTTATNVLINAVSPALTAGYVNAGALFTNPDIRGAGSKADWTSGYTNISWGCFENYHTSHGDRKLTQTKSVPNGFYKVVFHGIWRQDGSDAAPALTLRSGDNSVSANVPCMTDVAFGVGNTNGSNNWKDASGKIIPDGMQSAGEALSHGNAQVTISDFVVSNGELTIEMNTSSETQWILAQGFDIYFKAESIEEYANMFNAAKSAAEAIDQNTLNTYAKNTLTTALENAATEQINKVWYQEHTAALNDAVTVANDIATAYPKTSALLAICNDIINNSVEFEDGAKETFSGIVTPASENVTTAQTSAAINEIYNAVEAARQTYVQKADPINGTYFDYTFLIVNPSFETGDTEGWTTGSGGDTGAKLNSNGTYTINGADGEFVFNTWGADNLRVEQTLKGMPTGIYELKAIVASDATNVIKLTAGNQTADITITTDKNTATEGVVETSYSSGDFLIKAASATWFKADHFRLYYYGFDVATAQKGVTDSKVKAEGLLEKPMNANVKEVLQEVIANADATKTNRNELNPMVDTLNKVIAAAEASIKDYELIASYIAKANTINESIAATYQEQFNNGTITESTDTIFQNLEVATYNYVTQKFNYAVPISSTWNSTGTNTSAAEFNNEHWSGEIRPYMNQKDGENLGYNASQWSLDFDQEVVLPAGEYVFKVAGRKSVDAILQLVVTKKDTLGIVSDFPNGSKGLGINKAGEASFNPNDQFTRDDNTGFGWQWRYVRFVLDAEDTVKIAVHAETNKKSNWVSFGDYTLQMTEATYLEANKGALDTPTAEAEALVDTPMGNAENQALKSALAMTYTTGAELLAKIEALETAVANAKASAAVYKQIATYIAKANTINESIAATYQEQYNNGTITESTDTIFQNLEVATYNYVTTNFTYAVKLSDTWNSTGTNTKAATFSNEHWSGEVREYKNQDDNNSQGWNASAWSLDFDQEVVLPAGEYVFKVAGRKSADATLQLVVTKKDTLGIVSDFPNGSKGLGINKAGEASFNPNDQFTRDDNTGFGWQWRYVRFVLDAEDTVKIAVHAETNKKYNWVSFGDYTLQMTEATYLEANKGALDAPTAEAEALVDTVPMGNAENQALKSALAMTYTTGAELLAKIEALETAVANAKASAATYKQIATYIAKANNINKAIAATYQEQYDNGTITESTDTIFQNLEVATYNYVTEVFNYPVELPAGDWISEGPTGSKNEKHWSGESRSYLEQSSNAWGQNAWTITYKQDKTLPAGDYVFKVAGRRAPGTGNTMSLEVVNINDSVNPVKLGLVNDFPEGDSGLGINKAGEASFDANDTIVGFANNNAGFGWQWRYVKFTLANETKVQVAVKAEATAIHQWVGFCDATLQMTEATYMEANKGALDVPTAEAEAMVDSVVMGNAENQALKSALAMTYTTGAELLAKIEALEAAVANAKASAAVYKEIAPYIAKANAIDASIAADYKTQYDNRAIEDDAKTIFENLEVATYNYVTTNFTYAVKLSDTWNSTGTNTKAATFSNEHWSGEVREYKNQDDSNGQGWNASAWSLDFDQEVTLPAGEYIFKVAGRKSADATLQLVVTKGEETLGTVEDFPVSSKARGINKAGATSFDANDTIVGFANNGEGYGWQWRYVRFVLEAEDTVKIAVHAETNKKYNWVSFGDYTLQMTEETYLEANKGGLDAPTAEAEKLVADTIMGDTVRTALKDALAMTYTTGAELLAKIEALETAVANAKAWVKAYNEAKAPLVAALERFEADYNDGENGAKQYMAKSRWATVVTMAQEAAVAKDATNSYAGFAAATENLVSALDSADVSIKEYAALNEAIKNAEAIIASKVNWGDKPFQRPTSAKEGLNTTTAQGVYDAAEADGEGVTSVTTALTKAIAAANQLNAPEEGDAFYMTVAVAGHAYESYPVVASLGTPGNNNPTGYVFTAKTKEANACKLFTFTQVEGNNYNISFKMDSVIVYLTYGSLNGSAAGWNKQQIQATTVAENKGTFAIEASTITEGAIKIRNTVTGNYLDCEDGGSIYTNDDITKDEFGIIAQGTILSDSINIPYENKFATRVLMFDAVLPEGLKAYKYSSVENDCLILQEIEGTVPAYTPCLLHAEYGFEGTLEGTIVMDGYSATVTKDNILHGAIKQHSITEGYTLQKEEGADVAFYAVGNEQEVVIPAGECWLSVIKDIAAETIYLTIAEGGTVGIDKAQINVPILNGAIYTLDGKRVNSMLPGQIYIINGKKVMVK